MPILDEENNYILSKDNTINIQYEAGDNIKFNEISSSDIDKIVQISGRNWDPELQQLNNKIENLSYLNYLGPKSISDIESLSNIKNGSVYSIADISGTFSGIDISGNEYSFYVEQGDDIAYTSANKKWNILGNDLRNSWKHWSEARGSTGFNNSVYIGENNLANNKSYVFGTDNIASGTEIINIIPPEQSDIIFTDTDSNTDSLKLNFFIGYFPATSGASTAISARPKNMGLLINDSSLYYDNYNSSSGGTGIVNIDSTFGKNVYDTVLEQGYWAPSPYSYYRYTKIISVNETEFNNILTSISQKISECTIDTNYIGSYAIGSGNSAQNGSYAIGSENSAQYNSYAIGSGNSAQNGSYAIGSENSAQYSKQILLGYNNLSLGYGELSIIGYNNLAHAGHILGYGNIAEYMYNGSIIGYNNFIETANNSYIFGLHNLISGTSHEINIFGRENIVSGYDYTIIGNENDVSGLNHGLNSVMVGSYNIASNFGIKYVLGNNNILSGNIGGGPNWGAYVIGGYNDVFAGVVLGYYNSAHEGMILGDNNTAYDAGRAFGRYNYAANDGIAIGWHTNAYNGSMTIFGNPYGSCTSATEGSLAIGVNAIACAGGIAYGKYTNASNGSMSFGGIASNGSISIINNQEFDNWYLTGTPDAKNNGITISNDNCSYSENNGITIGLYGKEIWEDEESGLSGFIKNKIARNNSISIGNTWISADEQSISIGHNNVRSLSGSYSIGSDVVEAINGSIAIGKGTVVAYSGSMSIGINGVSSHNDGLVFGKNGVTANYGAFAIGMYGVNASDDAFAIGKNGVVANSGGWALGQAGVYASGGWALGQAGVFNYNPSNGKKNRHGFAIGRNGVCSYHGSIGIGSDGLLSEQESITIGQGGITGRKQSLAFGFSGISADNVSVALASQSTSAFNHSIAIGALVNIGAIHSLYDSIVLNAGTKYVRAFNQSISINSTDSSGSIINENDSITIGRAINYVGTRTRSTYIGYNDGAVKVENDSLAIGSVNDTGNEGFATLEVYNESINLGPVTNSANVITKNFSQFIGRASKYTNTENWSLGIGQSLNRPSILQNFTTAIGTDNMGNFGVHIFGNENNALNHFVNSSTSYEFTNATILGEFNSVENYNGYLYYKNNYISDIIPGSARYATRSFILGEHNTVTGYNAFAFGISNSNGISSYGWNEETSSYESNSDDDGFTFTFGLLNRAVRNYDMAIGYNSVASGGENIAIGVPYLHNYNYNATTSAIGIRNIAINGAVTGFDNIAIKSYVSGEGIYAKCDSYDGYYTNFEKNILFDSTPIINDIAREINHNIFDNVKDVNINISSEFDNNYLKNVNNTNIISKWANNNIYRNLQDSNIVSITDYFNTYENVKSSTIISNYKFDSNSYNTYKNLCNINLTMNDHNGSNILYDIGGYNTTNLFYGMQFTANNTFAHNIIINAGIFGQSEMMANNIIWKSFVNPYSSTSQIQYNNSYFNDNILIGTEAYQTVNESFSFGIHSHDPVGFKRSYSPESTVLGDTFRVWNFGQNSIQHSNDSFVAGLGNEAYGINGFTVMGRNNYIESRYRESDYDSSALFIDGIILGTVNTICSVGNTYYGGWNTRNYIIGHGNTIYVSSSYNNSDLRIIGNSNHFAGITRDIINSILYGASGGSIYSWIISGTKDSEGNIKNSDSILPIFDSYNDGSDNFSSYQNYPIYGAARNTIIGSKSVISNNITDSVSIGNYNAIYQDEQDYSVKFNNINIIGSYNLGINGSNQFNVGFNNITSGHHSTAIGEELRANQFQIIIGKYNSEVEGTYRTTSAWNYETSSVEKIDNSGILFAIGNGRLNLYEKYDNDNSSFNWYDENNNLINEKYITTDEYITRSNAMIVSADGTVSAKRFIESEPELTITGGNNIFVNEDTQNNLLIVDLNTTAGQVISEFSGLIVNKPTTGKYILECNNGILEWIEQSET